MKNCQRWQAYSRHNAPQSFGTVATFGVKIEIFWKWLKIDSIAHVDVSMSMPMQTEIKNNKNSKKDTAGTHTLLYSPPAETRLKVYRRRRVETKPSFVSGGRGVVPNDT